MGFVFPNEAGSGENVGADGETVKSTLSPGSTRIAMVLSGTLVFGAAASCGPRNEKDAAPTAPATTAVPRRLASR